MPPELRSLPLYAGLGCTALPKSERFLDSQQVKVPHPGLVFDKFIDTWNIDQQGQWEIQKPDKLKKGSKYTWLEETIELYHSNKDKLNEGLERTNERHEKLVKASNGIGIPFKSDWRFVSGLGNGHPFETGFIWHRTLGVPYLPGSSVKGLIRAWADPRPDKDGNLQGWGDPNSWPDVKHLFGDTNDDGAGRLIVFDALPMGAPKIELDIMNPHYGDYYSDNKKLIPPADYLSPIPIFFLVVAAGQEFCFSLAPRPGAYRGDKDEKKKKEDDLKLGNDLLKEALTTLGSGGKTAVGYGRFAPPADLLSAEKPPVPATKMALPRFKVGEKVSVKRIEDPKRKGRTWFEAEDGFRGCVTLGQVPQVAVGERVNLWIAAVIKNGYNFRGEPKQ